MSNTESPDKPIDPATLQRYVVSLRQWSTAHPTFVFAGKTAAQWAEEIEQGNPAGLSMLRSFMEFDAHHSLQPESSSPLLALGEAKGIIQKRMAQVRPLLEGIMDGRFDHVINADPPLTFEELRAFFRQQIEGDHSESAKK